MTAKVGDLIHQTTSSTGTGNMTLAPINARRTFNSQFPFGPTTDTFYYFITQKSNSSADEWEIGTGHMSTATTMVRDTVIASSNSNALVNFSAGVKHVVNDVPASLQTLLEVLGSKLVITQAADVETKIIDIIPHDYNATTYSGQSLGSEALLKKWGMVMSGPNPPLASLKRPNRPIIWGYNCEGNGYPEDLGDITINDRWENYYNPAGLGNQRWGERHIQVVGRSGVTAYRPMGMAFIWNNGNTGSTGEPNQIITAMQNHEFDILSSTAAVIAQFKDALCLTQTDAFYFNSADGNTQILKLTPSFIFAYRNIYMIDGFNLISEGNGSKIGTSPLQKWSFWNATPIIQPATTGTTTGFTANAGTPVLHNSTFTGGTGTKAYTIGDIVLALKSSGLMAAS